MTPPESTSVAHEIAELRRTMEVGFTRVDGQLALLVQRTEQTDKTLAEHDQRLTALERNRWPLPAVATLTSLGALGVAVWQSVGR